MIVNKRFKDKKGCFGLRFVLEIFRFCSWNAVVQTARNISKRRKLTFNLPLTVHAVSHPFYILIKNISSSVLSSEYSISDDAILAMSHSSSNVPSEKEKMSAIIKARWVQNASLCENSPSLRCLKTK